MVDPDNMESWRRGGTWVECEWRGDWGLVAPTQKGRGGAGGGPVASGVERSGAGARSLGRSALCRARTIRMKVLETEENGDGGREGARVYELCILLF